MKMVCFQRGVQQYRFIGAFLGTIITFFACANSQATDKFKEFEIVVPSFNDAPWVERNLASVCFQNYPRSKYHVTYINDASTDATEKLAKAFIKKNHLESLVTLVTRDVHRGTPLENRYFVIQGLPDNRIVAECDGDDFYENENVLSTLNEIYQDQDVWMLYTTRYRVYPEDRIAKIHSFTQQEIKNNAFRKLRNFTYKPPLQLRSYYAWLFKKVKINDLLYKGRFYPIVTDSAYMMPMQEMSGMHTRYVPQVLYVRNTSNPLSVKKVTTKLFRRTISKDISLKKPYQPIAGYQPVDAVKKNKPDFIICSSHETDIDAALKNKLISQLRDGQNDFVAVFFDEDVKFKTSLALEHCIDILVGSGAEILVFHPKLPWLSREFTCVQLSDSIWAGKVKYNKNLFKYYYEPKGILCSKQCLLHILEPICFTNTTDLIGGIKKYRLQPSEVCLFYEL